MKSVGAQRIAFAALAVLIALASLGVLGGGV